jgi:PAS domain S-box-containing protein
MTEDAAPGSPATRPLYDLDALAPFAAKLAGVGFWFFDHIASKFVWSEEMYRIYGLDPESDPPDIETLNGLCHPDDRERLLQHQERNSGKDASIEVRIVRPDGEVRHVVARSTFTAHADGSARARIGVLTDITEMKRAEADALEREQRYRFVTDNAHDMIVRVSLDAKLNYISPGSLRVFGYTPEEMATISPRDMTHPDDLPHVSEAILELMQKRLTHLAEPLRYRAQCKDGRWIWVESNPTLVFNAQGEPVETIDIVRDITETKLFEAELEEARLKAEAAAAAKSAFLANMSHELRTPLTSIIGFSRLMRERADLPAEAQQHARRIYDASEALLAIINDVLDLSKLEAGQTALELQPLSLRQLADETMGLMAIQAAAKGLELRLELDPKAPELILGDVTRLRQILLNLLSNAVKFTERGSVVVKTGWQKTRAGGRLKVQVTDTGAGIAADTVSRLFERFSQAEVSINRTHGGTGLGLSISKAIVGLMGGQIGVESEVGLGSTFWFEIPAQQAEGHATDQVVATELDWPPLKILMVDDTTVNRELVRLMLEPLGLEIEEAAGGADGVQAAMTRSYDLILMDVRMPGVDGLEATRVIRAASALNRRTPILALTADVQPENASACRNAGMDDVIAKPIAPQELLSKLAHWAAASADSKAQASVA